MKKGGEQKGNAMPSHAPLDSWWMDADADVDTIVPHSFPPSSLDVHDAWSTGMTSGHEMISKFGMPWNRVFKQADPIHQSHHDVWSWQFYEFTWLPCSSPGITFVKSRELCFCLCCCYCYCSLLWLYTNKVVGSRFEVYQAKQLRIGTVKLKSEGRRCWGA